MNSEDARVAVHMRPRKPVTREQLEHRIEAIKKVMRATYEKKDSKSKTVYARAYGDLRAAVRTYASMRNQKRMTIR